MLFDRTRRNAARRETLAQPSGVICKNNVARIRFEKGPVMTRAVRLIAVTQFQASIEGVGMWSR